MQLLTILGSTGSIGVSALDVVSRNPGRFRVVALTANKRTDILLRQCQIHRPRYAVVVEEKAGLALRRQFQEAGIDTEVLCGGESLKQVASLPEVNTVIAAIVGIAGLGATLAAAMAGKKILLANKESLVTAGALFMEAVRENNAQLLPVDSEHNAIFQAMPTDRNGTLSDCGVRRILLTASGGPFLNMPVQQLSAVTPEQAVAHPNWSMGRKISVDSATMMNKGLEVIEARWLFSAAPSVIEVVIHPQSVVHSLVEYCDGSVLAQLGNPDMRTPIAHALGYPERIESGVDFLDLIRVGTLQFSAPDPVRFPCLRLAYDALRAGDAAVIALNAANEIAVAEFLERRIRYLEIPALIEDVMSSVEALRISSIEDVEAMDAQARSLALERSRSVKQHARKSS